MAISTVKNDGLEGPISIAKGGTGATTAAASLNNILPTQTGNSAKFLVTDGSNTSWSAVNSTPDFLITNSGVI